MLELVATIANKVWVFFQIVFKIFEIYKAKLIDVVVHYDFWITIYIAGMTVKKYHMKRPFFLSHLWTYKHYRDVFVLEMQSIEV